MIVDDEPSNIKLAQECLRRGGLACELSSDGGSEVTEGTNWGQVLTHNLSGPSCRAMSRSLRKVCLPSLAKIHFGLGSNIAVSSKKASTAELFRHSEELAVADEFGVDVSELFAKRIKNNEPRVAAVYLARKRDSVSRTIWRC